MTIFGTYKCTELKAATFHTANVMHKTKKMKNLLPIILIILFSCNQDHSNKLKQDPLINNYFNKNEIKELTEIIHFFETESGIKSAEKNITESYKSFLEKIKPDTKPEDIEINISFDNQVKFFNQIDTELFNELWNYQTHFDPFIQDSTKSIHFNYQGKYFKFLDSLYHQDSLIRNYYEVFLHFGEPSPSLLAYSMMDFNKYELNLDRIRLIIAINFLYVNEYFRLSKKYYE